MGTRADFYVGRGRDAEWLGSIAWDGYPGGIDNALLTATTVEEYRAALGEFFKDRDDVTPPEMGWPWPWENSHTTDYAYAFDGGMVYGSSFGSEWFEATNEPEDDDLREHAAEFPDMSGQKGSARVGSRRSGVMVISAPTPPEDVT